MLGAPGSLSLLASELYSDCKECARAVGGAALLELRDCCVKCSSEFSGIVARCCARATHAGRWAAGGLREEA